MLECLRHAVSVNDRIIPGRHQVLIGVPVRRDVGVRSDEHHQHFGAARERLAGGIGARQMKAQGALVPAVRVEHHRHVGGIESSGHLGNQSRERVIGNEIVGESDVVL